MRFGKHLFAAYEVLLFLIINHLNWAATIINGSLQLRKKEGLIICVDVVIF